MTKFREGRKNLEAYSYFCFFFLRRAISHGCFKTHFGNENASVSKLFTESDEGFVLAILETHWKFWEENAEELRKKGGSKNLAKAKKAANGTQQDGEETEKTGFVKLYNDLQEACENDVLQDPEQTKKFDAFFVHYIFKKSGGLFGCPPVDNDEGANDQKQVEKRVVPIVKFRDEVVLSDCDDEDGDEEIPLVPV